MIEIYCLLLCRVQGSKEESTKSSAKENPIIQRRGRPKKTIQETIRKDLSINNLTVDMCKDRTRWRQLIYIADPT